MSAQHIPDAQLHREIRPRAAALALVDVCPMKPLARRRSMELPKHTEQHQTTESPMRRLSEQRQVQVMR